MSKTISLSVILAAILVISACDPNMVYDEYQKTGDGIWNYRDIKRFETEITDSLQSYNLLVNIRHTTDYPASNLYVFITTSGPAGISLKDTLEILIANERGKWQGYGFGKIKHISRMYKSNVRFSRPGNYVFTVEQAVREPDIPVTDVGFRIEKYKYTE